MCGRSCAAGTTCAAGACAPVNDNRASATTLTLTATEVTVTGTTVGATFDGPTTCASSVGNSPNLWYRVTLAQREVLYADTAGSMFDTRLYLVDSAGAVVTGSCSDDGGCSVGDFTSSLQSRFAVVVNAGTYFIAMGGYGPASTGAFTLHVQHMAATYGSTFVAAPITATGMASGTLGTGSLRTPTCGGGSGASGEEIRWFTTCGVTADSIFSLCSADGGTWSRAIGTTTYDPVMYVYSGRTGTQVQCNDDVGDSERVVTHSTGARA
jgi:hypothetical protein